MWIKEDWIGFKTLVMKECMRMSRIWQQCLIAPALMMILYFLIFGHIMGERIGNVEGVSYVQYIAPGLILMSVIGNAFNNVSSSLFIMRMVNRSLEEILVSPLSDTAILFGMVSGGVLRGIAVGLIVTIIALFFTHLPVAHIGVIFGIALSTTLLFSLAGFLNAMVVRTFDELALFYTFFLTPLTYIGGVFFPISALSPFWKTLSLGNPILYLIDAFRYGFLGKSDIPITVAFVMIACFIVGLLTVNYVILLRGKNLRQ